MKEIFSRSRLIGLFVLVALGFQAGAEDKSSYHLFNPVPDDQLRELTGDRPDGTESPTTVDAGHFQFEVSSVDYLRNRNAEGDLDALTAGATNVRIGLLSDLELQVIFDLYAREEFDPAGGRTEISEGFSDITLRPKLNLWGNDEGPSALAIMPAIKIPTGTELSNGEVEGGIVVPFGTDLADGVGLGLMAEVDWVYNEESDDYDTELFHTAVVGFDVTDALGVYLEYIGIAGEDAYQPSFSGGVTCLVDENLQLDAGAVVGLNENADDLQIFTGFTIRF